MQCNNNSFVMQVFDSHATSRPFAHVFHAHVVKSDLKITRLSDSSGHEFYRLFFVVEKLKFRLQIIIIEMNKRVNNSIIFKKNILKT